METQYFTAIFIELPNFVSQIRLQKKSKACSKQKFTVSHCRWIWFLHDNCLYWNIDSKLDYSESPFWCILKNVPLTSWNCSCSFPRNITVSYCSSIIFKVSRSGCSFLVANRNIYSICSELKGIIRRFCALQCSVHAQKRRFPCPTLTNRSRLLISAMLECV